MIVNFFSVKDFSAATWVRILKFSTKLESDELYCVAKKNAAYCTGDKNSTRPLVFTSGF